MNVEDIASDEDLEEDYNNKEIFDNFMKKMEPNKRYKLKRNMEILHRSYEGYNNCQIAKQFNLCKQRITEIMQYHMLRIRRFYA